MKKLIKSKKGEGYIDVVIGIFAMMMVLVVVLNIFQFMTLKQDLDEISGQLIETATFNGCFDSEFDERVESLQNQFFDLLLYLVINRFFRIVGNYDIHLLSPFLELYIYNIHNSIYKSTPKT